MENNIHKLPNSAESTIRSRSDSILNLLPSFPFPNPPLINTFKHLTHTTNTFLRENPNLILTRADKGNVTVAMDRDNYIQKMEELLQDRNTYNVIIKDPTRKLTTCLRDLLARWKKSEYISHNTHRWLYVSDGVLPRAYGLPKIHKEGCPLRLIVSSINSPLYKLASYLHKIMYNYFPKPNSHIKNSFKLVKNLAGLQIEDEFMLVSLDAVSLFTNIPLDKAIDGIAKRWHFISNHIDIPKNEFLIAVNLVLRSTFFTFNSIIYQQTFGTPMGSPLSPLIADIVIQDLEESMLETLSFRLPFYIRYVDDIACAIPKDKSELILNLFNSYHPRLQFTMEICEDGRLNFLDVTLILFDNHIIFDWFHKATFSGRYLNFLSQHPLCQKRGTVIGLIDRIFNLSHPTFHCKNLKLIIDILLNNSYPLWFVFKTLHERIKSLVYKSNDDSGRIIDSESSVSYFSVPYVQSLSERFKDITKDLDVRISYFSLNKLNRFIRTHKDSLCETSKSNVVYKINCKDCDASYVGQTGRQLRTRIIEHKNQIKHNTANHSVITDHRLKFDHDFLWDDVEILDSEPIYHKRAISEMLFINRQKNSINLQTDTAGLHASYVPVINRLSKL